MSYFVLLCTAFIWFVLLCRALLCLCLALHMPSVCTCPASPAFPVSCLMPHALGLVPRACLVPCALSLAERARAFRHRGPPESRDVPQGARQEDGGPRTKRRSPQLGSTPGLLSRPAGRHEGRAPRSARPSGRRGCIAAAHTVHRTRVLISRQSTNISVTVHGFSFHQARPP